MTTNGVLPQFSSQFVIKVPKATKNGTAVEFFIDTLKVGDERAIVVIRLHEDFLWLLHCLKTQDDVKAIIFPPLPPAPTTSLQAAEKRTRKQVGEKASVLVGDDYVEHCKAYEKFLVLCSAHPRLGKSTVLQKFLCEREAPARVKVRRGIFDVLTKTVDDLRLMNFKDSDVDLQQTRVSNSENIKHMKAASLTFQHSVDIEHRISNSYTEIQQATKTISSSDAANMDELCQILSQAVEHASEMSHVIATNRQRTVGATLKLYAGFSVAEQEMLQKRVLKLLELENAKKSFEKAKPQKKQQAEELMKSLEREVGDMTSLAKPELERYNRQRVLAYQAAITQMVESEIKTARDGLAVFTKLYSSVQKIQL